MTAIDDGALSAQSTESLQSIGRQRQRAIAVTAALILCVVSSLSFEIPKGTLTHTDELLTAERSREMLSTDPWASQLIRNMASTDDRRPTDFRG